MAISYYGIKLSDNLAETPEGYLVFRNAVIARTGFQQYKGKELPQRQHDTAKEEICAQDLGINDDDTVDLYRSPEEVFSPRTIASFESKPITDSHPDQLLDSETHGDYACGHIRNVRKGSEAMEDGNWPLLADGVVTDKNLILKIKAGLRELSCGYNYHILKQGNQILQVDIVGNHVAVVVNGRAGPLASIKDAALVVTEKIPMNKSEMKKLLVAMGFKSFAATAEPSQLLVAMDCMSEDAKPAVDAEPAKDATPVEVGASDAKASDARTAMHDALDKMLDDKEAEQKAAESGKDAAMDALKSLFSAKDSAAYAEGEKEDANKGEVEGDSASDADPEDDEEEEEEETAASDEAVQSEASPILEPEARTKPDVPSAVDAAYKAGQDAILKALKPVIAQSKDARLKAAFDTASKLTKPAVKTSGGGNYKAAASAAAAVGKDHNVGEDPYAAANAAYKAQREAALKAGKR
jgi:hypothetical protein